MEQVGYFECEVARFAEWLASEDFSEATVAPAPFTSLADITSYLSSSRSPYRYVLTPLSDTWTALMNNGIFGTDVGVLPSLAARQLGCRAVRALAAQSKRPYPGVLMEVFGPDGEPPLLTERSIVAANDGGRWVFETSGSAYSFEDLHKYERRLKAERFTEEMLFTYLRELGVPVDAIPNWHASMTVAV